MVGLKALLSIDGVVTTGVVRAVHPDLRGKWSKSNVHHTTDSSFALHMTATRVLLKGASAEDHHPTSPR